VLGSRVVKAALGTGLGIATLPGRPVDGEDERPVTGTMIDQEAAETLGVDAPLGQRLAEAAVRSAELRLQAQGGDRGDRAGCAEHSVAQLEEGVAPTAEHAAQATAERDELVTSGLAPA